MRPNFSAKAKALLANNALRQLLQSDATNRWMDTDDRTVLENAEVILKEMQQR